MESIVLGFGELLLRLSTQGNKLLVQSDSLAMHYGGAEANVCVSLSNFGIPTRYITKLPNNPIGIGGILNLNKYGVDTSSILLGEGRIGSYFLEQGAGDRGASVIYDRNDSLYSNLTAEEINWDAAFDGVGTLVLSGICPAVSATGAKTSLAVIKEAKKRNIQVVFDLNIREKLWKWGKEASEVLPDFLHHVDVLVGNEMHIKQLFKLIIPTEDEPEAWYYNKLATEILAQFPTIKKIAITSRRTYSATSTGFRAAFYDGKDIFLSKRLVSPQVVDRVGSGDAFTAGLIYGLLAFPNHLQKVIDFGSASAFLKHSIVGDFNQVSAQTVESFINNQEQTALSR